MKQLRLPIFTSKIKYYNLRIVPPEPVFDEVMNLKRQFEDFYGKQPLSKSKPHITIASFRMNSKHQELLVDVLDQLRKNNAFKLTIDGFGSFDESRTLYVRVLENEALTAIHKDVKSICDEYLKGRLKLFSISNHPHITLSKTTGKKMLAESLQHFRQQRFFRQIDIAHLVLVSRAKYRTWDWEYAIGLS